MKDADTIIEELEKSFFENQDNTEMRIARAEYLAKQAQTLQYKLKSKIEKLLAGIPAGKYYVSIGSEIYTHDPNDFDVIRWVNSSEQC